MTLPLLLLVDDAPDIALIIRHQGKRAGYTLNHCPDGEAAWEYLLGVSRTANPKPDLLLVDYHLPRRTGAQWCQQIRAVQEWADVPIALFSHWTEEGDLVAALEAGADYILSKELLGDPEAWRTRLDEIWAPAGPQTLPRAPEEAAPAGADSVAAWQQAVAQTLQHPSIRCLGGEVLRVLCRRAVQHLRSSAAARWLDDDGHSLDFARIPPAERPRAAAALAEQIARVLGRAAGAPFRAALVPTGGGPAG